MIATVTKKFVTIGDIELMAGDEVDVLPDRGSTKQVHYTDTYGTLHVAYNINDNWLANIVVYRRAKDLGYA